MASNLGGETHGFSAWLRRALLIDVEAGAQTPLWCATQRDVEPGGYYHNTLGRVRLAGDDPAADQQRAAALWELMERLSAT